MFILMAVWICTNPSLARTTWYIPGDFPTIQVAMADPSVVDGDTVVVRPGTCTVSVE